MKEIGKTMNKVSHVCILISCFLFVCSCSKDDDTDQEGKIIKREYHIGVVLPQKGADLKNAIEWSLNNLNGALIEQRQIKVSVEWFDENDENIEELFKTLAHREDISAIIGPLYSKNANIAAKQCYQTNKTLIPPTVSSETIMRQYSGNGFLWCLTENDISQCEVLLTRAIQKGAKTVSLLTSNDEYGITFRDWFAFQAHELDLTVHSIEQYDATNVTEKMNSLLNEDTDCLICVPNNKDITQFMNDCRRTRTRQRPSLLFSDVAYITPKDITFEGMEGISQIHDPQSGFHIAYKVKFNEEPNYGSAHYFDAVTLAGLAILDTDLAGNSDINASIRKIVDGTGEIINSIQEKGIQRAVECLINGESPHIDGASGKLYFDKSIYTNVIHSVYCHWQVYQGKHLILEYNTSDDSNRTNASAANWNWKVTKMQDFDKNNQISYPQKEETYALIVATASGWENYRHQANAYSIYRLLKQNGLDDNHILLISEDDIAFNSSNPTPGFIQFPSDDKNVYENIKVDYHPSEINLDGLLNILSGEADAASSHPGLNDNLFVYWAGHGEPEGPYWLNKIIPSNEVADFFSRLSEKKCFRKLFFAMEACYAGKVGLCCEDRDIKGMLCITAANEKETSKAYAIGTSGVWISNSFSHALIEQLGTGKTSSVYDLYHNIYNLTIGSHVSVYNAKNFGNLYTTSINEFLYP